jgi:hypothetical protein
LRVARRDLLVPVGRLARCRQEQNGDGECGRAEPGGPLSPPEPPFLYRDQGGTTSFIRAYAMDCPRCSFMWARS